MIDEFLFTQPRQELVLYKSYAKDDAFNQAFFDTMKRLISKNLRI